ncbi:otogelin [Mantella aurantiaca]
MSSHAHVLSCSCPLMLLSSHAHVISCSSPLMLLSSHAHVLSCSCPLMHMSSHAHVLSCSCPLMLMSSHAHVLSCSCPLMLMSSHAHVLSCSCPLMLMSSHAHVLSCSCSLMLMFSHAHVLSCSCPLMLMSGIPAELLPCFNGGECVQKKFCDCGRYNASGSRCQIVYNTGVDRENICRTWGQYHYETFDGVYFYYPGVFTFDLLRHSDPDEPSFAIQVHNDPSCSSLPYSCMRSFSLYFAGIGEIKLQNQIVLYNNNRMELPYTVGNVKIQAVSGYVIVRQQYVFSMAWDGNSSVYLKMSPDFFGRTQGLCGNNNWTPQDDLMSHSMCSVLLHAPFQSCHDLVSAFPFMASCTSDLCMSNGDVGTWCQALAEYARSCAHAGHPLHGWRETFRQCAIPCEADLVYNECITCCPNSCHQKKPCIDSEIACVDGCYCTEGMIFENGTCVHPSECPCDFHGTVYPAGSVVRDRCNNCIIKGRLCSCQKSTLPVSSDIGSPGVLGDRLSLCPWRSTLPASLEIYFIAECSVTGDFHIVTYDGRKFTFQAPCQYILSKSRNSGAFTVSVQNAPCGQNLDGSCIQSVNLIMDQDQRKQVTLTQAGDVLVYDQYKINLPYTDDVFKVRKLSSVFVQVKTDIGLQLLYDRQGLRLYVQLDGRWKDNTAGLCGTFNDNTQDDFLSPVGVPESTPQLFGYSWKTLSACRVEYPPSPLDPCDVHLQAASYASESCSIVTSDLFAPCHPYLSPVSYYEQCRRDTCKCGEGCLCSALAHYAYQCRSYGIIIDFRSSFPDCEQSKIAATSNVEQRSIAATSNTEQSLIAATSSVEKSFTAATSNTEQSSIAATSNTEQSSIAATSNIEQSSIAATSSVEKSLTAATSNTEQSSIAATSNVEQSLITAASNKEQSLIDATSNIGQSSLAATSNREQSSIAASSNVEQSSIAATSNVEQRSIVATSNVEQSSIAATSSVEQSLITATSNTEQSSIAATSNVEQSSIAATSNVEQSSIAATSNTEQSSIAATSNVEQSSIAATSNVEQSSIAATSNTEQSSIAATSNVEQSSIAATSNVEQSSIAATSNTEQSSIAATSNTEQSSIAATSNVEQSSITATSNIEQSSIAATTLECPPGLIYYNCSRRDPDIELSRERTCENQLLNITASTHLPCVSGCVCPRGLVKHGNECFPPDACPCSWKAKEYFPGEVVNSSCHTCVCHHGSFQCSFRPCPAMCTFYGDRHFRTFDGLAFDFLGTCKVHLVKVRGDTIFSVIVENVNCYSSGIICRKSIAIGVGQSQILFNDDSGKPSSSSIMDRRQKLHIWQAGFFTFIHFPREDITILWDQRTTVHVQVGPQWQGLLTGLCGNFDLKTVNEMRTPDSYELMNPQEFGSSWAATECSDSPDTRNPCTLNPLREPFAKKECAILLSEVFEACHPVVDVTWFYSNCLSDTCGCNRGGDCECFCTSVSAYAHQCCQQGISVDWRSPRLCPYDCEFYNKVVGKGPYRLRSYSHSNLLLSIRFSDATVTPMSDDAVRGHSTNFMLTPGLYTSHDRNLVSLELADRPNYFLYAANNGSLLVAKWTRSQAFQSRATFLIRQNAWLAGYSAFESFANPGHFLRLSPTSVYLTRYRHSAAYRRSTLFRLSESPVLFRSACQWRYDACSSACFRTCRDPAGEHCMNVPKVEGCIPQCPPDLVLDEVTRKCVYFPDCIEPAIGVTTMISTAEPHKTSGLNVTRSPTSFPTPPSVTRPEVTSHRVPLEGITTSSRPGIVPTVSSSTLFSGSPVATHPESTAAGVIRTSTVPTPEAVETIRSVSRGVTSSPIILEGLVTTLNKTELGQVTIPTSPFLSPEITASTAKVTETTYVTSKLTSEVPITETVLSKSPGVTTERIIPAATSPVLMTTLTDHTPLSTLPYKTSMVPSALVTSVLTSESATTTLSTQLMTTVQTERMPSTEIIPESSEPHKVIHTSATSFIYPVTGPIMTSTDHSYSQMVSTLSLVPSSLSPLPSSTSTPYSVASSSGIRHHPSTTVLSVTRGVSTPEPWQSTAQTFLIATKLVTPTEGALSSITDTSITRSAIAKFTDRPMALTEAAKVTTEPSPIETRHIDVTSPLKTSKYSLISTDLTTLFNTSVSVAKTSLSTAPVYTVQTPAHISLHPLISSMPSTSTLTETTKSRTSMPTSTRIVISPSSRTTKTESTISPEVLRTSSRTTGPTTIHVSLSKPSAGFVHLATKPKPRVTEVEHTLETLKITESVLEPAKTTLRPEVVSTSATSAKVHTETVSQEMTSSKTHLLPSTEKSTSLMTTEPAKSSLLLTTFIQEPSNITASLKSITSTGGILLPTNTSVHDKVFPTVSTYPPGGLSQSTSHTRPTQETLIKTSSSLSTKNVTTLYVLSSTPFSPSDETSISMSGPISTYHVTDTSRLTKSTSQQTYSAISPSLSPAVSYSTTQLAELLTTKGKALLTDAVNTTYIPSSVSPLSTRSTPVGRPTEVSLPYMTTSVPSNVTEIVKPLTEKTETLFVSGENITEWRALSTAETYKTTSQLISASHPAVVSETLATYQPTIKESMSPGSVSKELQTSSVTITRDIVTGTLPPTDLISQQSLQTGVTSQQPLQTGVTPEVTHLPMTSNKTMEAVTIVTSELSSVYSTITEASLVGTSQPKTFATTVPPLPVTHSLNITTNQTEISSLLFSKSSQMSTQIPLTSSSETTQEMESSFTAELTGLTVSAMLPSRESATFLACTPYTENECIKHICVDGQLIQVNKSQHCPYNVTQPSCGLLGFAVQMNGDRCCPKWECACRCSVFSDLSFVTFDGRYLALYKEASYIILLTEEESITVQVSKCGVRPQGHVSNVTLCLSMLELTYLTNQIIIDRLSRKVAVNSRSAWPLVRKYGYRIVDTGNMYFIETPSSIRIQWFHSSGLMIIESNSTTKPPSMGLCGLCDGNTTNDLILPNGRVLTQSEDSDEFLDSWQVPYTLKYVGKERRQDRNCSIVDCSPCFHMIVNQTFSSCHPYVSPEEFCELWAQDAQYIQDPCKALTAYSAMCNKFNICIEWRNSDYCPFHCAESLIYRPCLPVCDVPRTCQNNEIDLYDTESCSGLTEACVCPEGTVLHRLYSAVCVPEGKCACTDSSGIPREIGEIWNTSVNGCCMYQCAANESIIPVRYNCSDTRDVPCRRYGEVTVTVPDNQTCCPRQMCLCNHSLCDSLIPTCDPHQKLSAYHREDSCCPRYTCECDPEKCGPLEDPPHCRDDQTLFLTPGNNSCCIRHLCGCKVCAQRVPTCQEGEILTIINNGTQRCCPIYQCVCDTTRCPDVTCDLGMSVLELWMPGSCCPYRTCECSCEKIPKPECDLGEKLQIDEESLNSVANPCNCTIYKCVKASVCFSKDGGVLRPGQTIIEHTSEGVCHTSHCTSVIDPISKYHQINVSSLRCAARCQTNQVYEPPRDVNRCCGHCRNVSCIQTLLNGTLLTHRPGSSWIAKCLRYDCTNTSVGPVLMTSAINCPPFNETECIKMGGYVVSFLEGCCKTCKEDGKFCKRVTVRMTIRKNDCRSNTPVNIVSCDGKCPSASIYNYNINTYARFCKCCRELGLQRRVVQLYCTGNSTWVNYSIQEPTDCSCQWS